MTHLRINKDALKVIIAFTLILIIMSFSKNESPKFLRYTDGNNNTYQLVDKILNYSPITKSNTSSGTYDPPATCNSKLELNKAQLNKLNEYSNQLILNSSDHLKNREMGCGTLTFEANDKKETLFINSISDLKVKFENYLNSLFNF